MRASTLYMIKMAWFAAGLAGPGVIGFALPVWSPGWFGLPSIKIAIPRTRGLPNPASPLFHGIDRSKSYQQFCNGKLTHAPLSPVSGIHIAGRARTQNPPVS